MNCGKQGYSYSAWVTGDDEITDDAQFGFPGDRVGLDEFVPRNFDPGEPRVARFVLSLCGNGMIGVLIAVRHQKPLLLRQR